MIGRSRILRKIGAGRSLGVAAVLFSVGLASAEPLGSPPTNRRYTIWLRVDARGVARSHCPAAVDVDFRQALADRGAAGTFDEHTIEVVGYGASGEPRMYDAALPGDEKYLLPWRLDKYWGLDKVTLNFVVPDQNTVVYAVRFDTVESGVGQPDRYHGLVGDGDLFSEGYKRREVNANHFDCFCDFDGDGDLDLFKAGVESFIWCWENVGGNRFVERGRMSSGGQVLNLPRAASNRSWLSVAFHDWDDDGDQDLFASFQDGPYGGQIAWFENTTSPGGQISFIDRGPVKTASGQSLFQGGWFPMITFVKDWDGGSAGRLDALVSTNNSLYLHRNVRRSGSSLIVDNPVQIKAGGAAINLSNPRFDAADIDADGDIDLFSGTQPGPIYFFKNTDTTTPRTNPTFAAGTVVAFETPYFISDAHSGVKVADFTGDGLPDFVVGRFWERTGLNDPAQPREYGWLYENVGTATAPQFARRDASSGAPYTEEFQRCDAIRQNCVRACDWDNDGKLDLISGDTDGHIWLFRNLQTNLTPVFATGEKLLAGGAVLSVQASGGHARHDVVDWDNDGRKDLLVADGNGWLTLFRNTGTDASPILAAGQRLSAGGSPIDRGGRSSCLVADWNNDGKKDVVFADQDFGYAWFQNTGTDAAPSLAAAQSLGLTIYTRPNLGDFVDWDGDGKKDLIACQFENDARLYRNVGSGQPGTTPQFNNPAGTIIVQPYTATMMMSGADVVDWRGDGDLAILSGQGHGGGALRFYERDYIDSTLNNNAPTVTIVPVDGQPPGPVKGFGAAPGHRQATLAWTNPADGDFIGTVIRWRADDYPADPTDGELLAQRVGSPNAADSVIHSGLLLGTRYHYAAYAHDGSFNYSTAAHALVMILAPGDFDRDGDVDQTDYGTFQACAAGQGSMRPLECVGADFDGDLDVDQDDLAVFLDCFSGANQTPGC